MKTLIVLCALLLSGCAGTFGHNSITVTANAAGGYDLNGVDGKEYAEGRSIVFDAKKGQLVYSESASKAFKGQALAVKALTVLPVTGLQDLVK
jgi:hypothetical protein